MGTSVQITRDNQGNRVKKTYVDGKLTKTESVERSTSRKGSSSRSTSQLLTNSFFAGETTPQETQTATTITQPQQTYVEQAAEIQAEKTPVSTVSERNFGVSEDYTSPFVAQYSQKQSVDPNIKSKEETEKEARQDAYRQRINRLNEWERNAAIRSERTSEVFRNVPFLAGDNYAQRFGREMLALPARATVGTAERISLAGAKLFAAGEGVIISEETRSAVGAEAVSAAKTTPRALAQSYDPRKPSGLANIVGTTAAVYLVGSARANYRATAAQKGTVKPTSITTKYSKTGKTVYATEKGGYTSLSGKAVNYKVVSKVDLSSGKGTYNLYLKSGSQAIKTVKGGRLNFDLRQTGQNTFTTVSKAKPSLLSRTTKTQSKVTQSQTQIKPNQFKQIDIINAKSRGVVSQTIRRSNVKTSGKTIITKDGQSVSYVPSKATQTNIKQATTYRPNVASRLKVGFQKGLRAVSTPDKAVYSGAEAQIVRSIGRIGQSVVSELTGGYTSTFSKPSTVFKGKSVVVSPFKTTFVSGSILVSSSIIPPSTIPFSVSVSRPVAESGFTSGVKTAFDPRSSSLPMSEFTPSTAPEADFIPTTTPDHISGGSSYSSPSSFSPVVSSSTFTAAPFVAPTIPIISYVPRITLGGFSGGGKYVVKNPFRKQQKEYTPTLTAASFNIRGNPTKFGVVSGLGLRPITTKKIKL